MLCTTTFLLLASLTFAEQSSLKVGPESNKTTYCVEIGSNEYCNVSEAWQPRISRTTGLLACALPTAYAVVALLVTMLVRTNKTNRIQEGKKFVKEWYRALVLNIYFADYVGEDLYRWITDPQPGDPHYSLFDKPKTNRFLVMLLEDEGEEEEDGIYVADYEYEVDERHLRLQRRSPASPVQELLSQPRKRLTYQERRKEMLDQRKSITYLEAMATKVRVCDAVEGKDFTAIFVTAKELKKHRECKLFSFSLPTWLFPKCLKVASMVSLDVLVPVMVLLVDIVDVFYDCFYFYKLEEGELIDGNITRNVHVSNAIWAFGLLGAIKSTIVAYCCYKIIRNSYSDHNLKGKFIKPISKCFKIFLEDGAEVILEYYFVDKFASRATGEKYWFLVVKDVLSAVYYTYPILKILINLKKYYKEIKKSDLYFVFNDNKIYVRDYTGIYLTCVLVNVLFSLITMLRIVGTIYQYLTGDISRECLVVTNGRIMQTPFNRQCLNYLDWVILALYGIMLIVSIGSVMIRLIRKLLSWLYGGYCIVWAMIQLYYGL